MRLGDLYEASGRYDEALAKLNEALKVNPRTLPAQMLVGVIYERKGDIAKAQQAYEKVLTLNPRFAPAANNLAWLYSEHGGDKEKALQLAQAAKEAGARRPERLGHAGLDPLQARRVPASGRLAEGERERSCRTSRSSSTISGWRP